MLRAFGRELHQPSAFLGPLQLAERQGQVALHLQLSHRHLTLSAARIAGDEYRIARARSGGIPGQVIGGHGGNVVRVEPQEGHIQVEAGEVEIVRIAAEEGHGELRREGQAHVGIAAVAVQHVLAAVIQADHLAAQVRLPLALGGLDLRDLLIQGVLKARRIVGAGLGHARGDVGHAQQHLGLHAGAFALLGQGVGAEAGFGQVIVFARQGLNAVDHAVVVGHGQTAARHDGGRAARRQAQGGQAHMVQPGLIDLDPIGLADRRGGKIVEGPHAFVGGGRRAP